MDPGRNVRPQVRCAADRRWSSKAPVAGLNPRLEPLSPIPSRDVGPGRRASGAVGERPGAHARPARRGPHDGRWRRPEHEQAVRRRGSPTGREPRRGAAVGWRGRQTARQPEQAGAGPTTGRREHLHRDHPIHVPGLNEVFLDLRLDAISLAARRGGVKPPGTRLAIGRNAR